MILLGFSLSFFRRRDSSHFFKGISDMRRGTSRPFRSLREDIVAFPSSHADTTSPAGSDASIPKAEQKQVSLRMVASERGDDDSTLRGGSCSMYLPARRGILCRECRTLRTSHARTPNIANVFSFLLSGRLYQFSCGPILNSTRFSALREEEILRASCSI